MGVPYQGIDPIHPSPRTSKVTHVRIRLLDQDDEERRRMSDDLE